MADSERKSLPLNSVSDEACRKYDVAIGIVGARWTAAVLGAASSGAVRFVDFKRTIDGISDRLLAVRLKELTREDLLRRTVIPTTPVQVHYSLTDEGRTLMASLIPLIKWSQQRERRSMLSEDRPD
jgi:DNA-binding HxlR family transcriptional regulator